MRGSPELPSRVRCCLVSGSKAVHVRTPTYVLFAERRDGRWCPELTIPADGTGSPRLRWIGIEDGGVVMPFRRAYLVSADHREFHVRFDADGGLRCHLFGCADAAALTAALCGASNDVGSRAAMLVQVEGAHEFRDQTVLVWPECRLTAECTLGDYGIQGGTICVAADGAARELSGDAPMAGGYVYAEIRLTVAPTP